ncbi:Or74a family protein [Megaselia abdita]
MLKWYYPQTPCGRPVNFVHWYTLLYKLACVWPVENSKILFSIGISLLWAVYAHSMFAEVSFILENLSEINLAIMCISNVTAKLNVICRMINVIWNHDKLKKVFDMLYTSMYIDRDEYAHYHDKAEQKIKILFSICNKYWVPMSIYSFSSIITLVEDPYNQEKPHVYPSYFPYYDDQSIAAYALINLSYIYIGVITICFWLAEDVFIGIAMIYTQARYQMLFEEIKDLRLFTGNISSFKIKLHRILKKQQILQEFKSHTEKLFSFPMSIAMGYSTLHFSILPFVLITNESGVHNIKFITWLLVELLEIFTLCYFGQRTSEAADDIKDEWYFCGWEELFRRDVERNSALSILKDIQIAITKSTKKTAYRTWYIWDLSFEGLVKVAQTSFTYFMFLRTLQVNIKNEF